MSPLTIFYAYYGVWYVIAPIGADSYSGILGREDISLAICLVYSTFSFGVCCILYGITVGMVQKEDKVGVRKVFNDIFGIRISYVIFLLFIFSTVMLTCIVAFSGGFLYWWNNPGDAFLNRSGTGVYVILSHFSTFALSIICGVYSYKKNSKLLLITFILWLCVTSPIHGSKFLLSVLIVLLFLPWIKDIKLFTFKTLSLYSTFLVIFISGLYFRDYPFKIVLNYFSCLENLALSLRDFEPGFFKTFFLPFVKFSTPFGLEHPQMYYDMNHMLTDIYYPDSWKIRATEQWPVETDLYLNFRFTYGLPIFGIYLAIIGYLYGKAVNYNTIGYWFASIMMTLYMVSHLRGSLINHTDFYMYPYIFIMFMILKNYSFRKEL